MKNQDLIKFTNLLQNKVKHKNSNTCIVKLIFVKLLLEYILEVKYEDKKCKNKHYE